MFASILGRAKSWLSRKQNPLRWDPEYNRLDALEAHLRARHMPVAHVTKAKRERVHQMLRGAA